MNYTEEMRFEMLQIYIENNRNSSAARRAYRIKYPGRRVPHKNTFTNIYKKMGNLKNLHNKLRRYLVNEDKELQVILYFTENQTKSLRDLERDLEIPRSSAQVILQKHKFTARKPVKVQKLQENDLPRRREFCEILLRRYREDRDIFKKIFWTDEAIFVTSGCANRKNIHYWANENLHITNEIQMQGRSSLKIWAGIYNGRVYYQFLDDNLTGQRYLNFLETHIQEILENIPLNEYQGIIWQQDGAPYHNVRRVTEFLNNNFREWIGKSGTYQWPPRSPDLTPLDFFLWGYLKNKVYYMRVGSVNDIRNKIIQEIEEINNSNILQNVYSNIAKRLNLCLERNGSHVENRL